MIKILEKLICDLDGVKLSNIEGVSMPEHLYKFPNNVYLSFEYDLSKRTYMTVQIGSLYYYDEQNPKIEVLTGLNIYGEILNSLDLTQNKLVLYSNQGTAIYIIDYLTKYLKFIVDNYEFFTKFNSFQENREFLLKKLRKYNVQDISHYEYIQDVVKIPNHKLNNNIKPLSLKKKRTRKEFLEALGDSIGELIVLTIAGIVGFGFIFLFSLEDKIKDLEDIISIGILIIIIISLFIGFIIYKIRPEIKIESINLHPLYYEDNNKITIDLIKEKFEFLINNGYSLKIKENKYQLLLQYKNDDVMIRFNIFNNIMNCYIVTKKTSNISILCCDYVGTDFFKEYIISNNQERINLIINVIQDNKEVFHIKDSF